MRPRLVRINAARIRQSAWLVPLIVGIPGVALYFVLPPAIENVAYEAFGALTAVAVLLAVRLHRPQHRLRWLLVALGFGLWTVGDAVSAILAPAGGDVPVPSWADLCYFAGYASLIVGVGLLAGPVFRGNALDRPALLDAAIVATTLGFGVWLVLINPLLDAPGVTLATAVVSAAYPMLDVLLIAVVARHVLINGRRPLSATLLVAGLGAYLAADLVNVREAFLGTYSAADPVNAGWLLGYSIAGAAILHPSMVRIGAFDEAMRPLSHARGLLLVLASVMPGVVILVHDSWDFNDRLVLGIAAVGLSGLVLLRLINALRDQQELRREMHFEARHDPLTGLANRTQFSELLEQALARATAGTGLLFLDLDGFKRINDSHGHATGDELLRVVADRLVRSMRAGDDVARLGGDEFAVIVPGAASEAGPTLVSRRVLDALVAPASVDGERVALRASIGVVWTAPGGCGAGELLRRADVAMYAAKAEGGGYCLYSPSLEAREAAAVALPALRPMARASGD